VEKSFVDVEEGEGLFLSQKKRKEKKRTASSSTVALFPSITYILIIVCGTVFCGCRHVKNKLLIPNNNNNIGGS
jgi:hypothetical protein